MVQTVRQQVLEIIAEQAVVPVSEIESDATPASLGLDSLGLVEAVFAIEETFDVEVPFNASAAEMDGFDNSSIAAIVLGVEALVSARARPAG